MELWFTITTHRQNKIRTRKIKMCYELSHYETDSILYATPSNTTTSNRIMVHGDFFFESSNSTEMKRKAKGICYTSSTNKMERSKLSKSKHNRSKSNYGSIS